MEKLKALLQRARAAVAARVVDDWRHLHKFYTTWVAAAGTALLSAWDGIPHVWRGIPDDVKAAIPPGIVHAMAYIVLLAVVIGAVTRQDFKRRGDPPDGGANV